MGKASIVLTALFFVCAALPSQDSIISETNFSSVIGAGARALGMGGAFIAIADDATAASWNPAGLAQLERFSLSVVNRMDSSRALIPARGDSVTNFFMGAELTQALSYGIDFASMTMPFRIGKVKIVPQVSYQRAISFNLSSRQNGIPALIPDEDPTSGEKYFFQGNFYNEDDFIGGFDMLSASLGTRLFPWLNLGFSFNYWMNGYKGEQVKGASGIFYTQSHPDIHMNADHEVLEGRTFDIKGVNFNLGILIEISENLKLGAVYKTAFTADIDYWNKTHIIDFREGGDKENVHEASGRSKLLWPRSFGLGISYRPSDPLTFSLDYTNTEWSKGKLLNYHFDGKTRDVYFPTLHSPEGEGRLNPQMDAEQIRLGMEFVVFGEKILIPLRAGFFTDSQYFSDVSGRTVSMTGFTAGMGVKFQLLSFDVAVIYQSGSYLSNPISYSLDEKSELKLYFSVIFSI